MSNGLHPYYLQTIGIDTWVRRESLKFTQQIKALELSAQVCVDCALHQTRTKTVFARGNPQAQLMVIGEAPGFHEDIQGLPFVGRAGLLLNKMLSSIQLTEEEVYITNAIKCRPPNNRDPMPIEITECLGYLKSQIELVKPTVILALGCFAAHAILDTTEPLSKLRGTIYHYLGIPVCVSYHPSYLLKNLQDKKNAYHDLLVLKQYINL
jgi:uracil-DNA glycosylase family 4